MQPNKKGNDFFKCWGLEFFCKGGGGVPTPFTDGFRKQVFNILDTIADIVDPIDIVCSVDTVATFGAV